jgi:hypothetical protein
MDELDVISPELALVDPELRERALPLLPPIEAYSFLPRRDPSPPAVVEPLWRPRLLVKGVRDAVLVAAASFAGLTLATVALTVIANALR